MNKIKKILIISLGVLIIILVLVLIFKDNFNKTKNINEAEQLINDNQIAINSTVMIKDLRGIDDSDIIMGKKRASVDIIIYEDLSDSYSVKFDETLDKITETFGKEIRVAFRPYASKMFPLSLPTYSFVDCAKEQGKFFEARDLVLDKVKNNQLAEENFSEYGETLQLDATSLNSCLQKDKYISEIENLSKEGETFGVYGSPTIFVNNELVVGARSFDDVENSNKEKLAGMKSIIEKYLKK
ncbi:MAG TPA: thioredoxin domain-containing protein [bacterium]|nr:thioredoxin domain-containing protein [bacterium]